MKNMPFAKVHVIRAYRTTFGNELDWYKWVTCSIPMSSPIFFTIHSRFLICIGNSLVIHSALVSVDIQLI